MILSNKKLLIFDLDGTLIDSSLDLSVAVNLMLKDMGLKEYEEEVIKGWVGNGAEVLVKRALSGKREYDENLDEEKVKQALEIFLNHYQNNLALRTKPYPRVLGTLKYLKQKGFKLSIVTNKPLRFVEPLLEKLELDGVFDLIYGGDSFEVKKPHPKPLLETLKHFQVTTKEAVMIGDSKNDIVAAKKADIDSVAVTYGYNYDEDISVYEPTIIINEFKELLKIFPPKVAIIGGGVAGSTASIYLANSGCDVTLFEKNSSLVSGPPFCHLHSGGNLYPQISLNDRIKLLIQSIDFVRFYPDCVDFRPTVLAFPKREIYEPEDYINDLEILQIIYKKFIEEDEKNRVLFDAKDYYKLYSKEDLLKLKELKTVKTPKNNDEWMSIFAKYVDLEKLKFPVILVSEFGLNIFRVSAFASLKIKEIKNIKLKTSYEVKNIKKLINGYKIDGEFFDYLVNATGYQTGKIDDMLDFKRDRLVEFKAAYITKWEENDAIFPEIVFHGKRGTTNGMGQFTPYPANHFQLHGMTKDITLFEDCLVKTDKSSMPNIPEKLNDIVENGWDKELVERRTNKAIEHISYFIPKFKSAKVASKPLYGVQQIPGDDPEVRAYEVSFEKGKRYARCEIVKASSVTYMSKKIVQDINSYGFDLKEDISIDNYCKDSKLLDTLASQIATAREYPKDMAYTMIKE